MRERKKQNNLKKNKSDSCTQIDNGEHRQWNITINMGDIRKGKGNGHRRQIIHKIKQVWICPRICVCALNGLASNVVCCCCCFSISIFYSIFKLYTEPSRTVMQIEWNHGRCTGFFFLLQRFVRSKLVWLFRRCVSIYMYTFFFFSDNLSLSLLL